ncbi:putative E3 ubiquitin-protein ligase TRIML1 [Plecturocebus cupreus]
MSTADPTESLRAELTCFLCLDYFRSPVATECGHSFCLVCLLRSWEEHTAPLSRPERWRTLEGPHFQPSERLGRLATIGRQLRSQLQQRRMSWAAGRGCPPLPRRSPMASRVPAASLQSHAANRAHLPSQAEEPHREKLQEILNLVRKRRREAQAVLAHEKERVILCKEETKTCKQVVVSEYVKMQQFLKKEEQLQLQLLEQEERENTQKLRGNEIRLTQQIRSLSKMIRRMESRSQSSALETLEEVRGILERSQPLLLQCPEAAITELSLCRITGTKEMLRKFSTDITLDPATASPYLVPSEDLKSVKYGGSRQPLPDTPGRFGQSTTVLGAQVFTAGGTTGRWRWGARPSGKSASARTL